MSPQRLGAWFRCASRHAPQLEKMLVLFETAAGFALFKVMNEGKLKDAEDLSKDFDSLDHAQKLVKLKAFSKFDNTTEALAAATHIVDNKVPKDLKKFLKKNVGDGDSLGVYDAKLGNLIKEKCEINCVYNQGILELMRGIRSQLEGLISGMSHADLHPMSLGLSHSLSRYKLKFSPDKVDTMIVQAIGLLDDLDKELNTYAMRVREWYGWHFPEMTKIVADNIAYARAILKMASRDKAAETDFAGALEEEVAEELKDAAKVSMGTEMSEEDLEHVMALSSEVVQLAEYRAQLYDYLKSRMQAIAPNLTVLVGELVGARLIAHAGSLMNLAKHPASTVQILGAEKALFRALKTKKDTPKYGLIYHASLVGQSAPKFKGKISRVLASKCALAIRVDALGDTVDDSVGVEGRTKVEARLRQLEGRLLSGAAGAAKGKPQPQKYDKGKANGAAAAAPAKAYNAAEDVKLEKKEKKRKAEAAEEEEPAAKKEKKEKKEEKKEKKDKKEKKEKKSKKGDDSD